MPYVFYGFLVVLFFLPVVTRHSLMDAAKMLVIELIFGSGFIFFYAVIVHKHLALRLHHLEERAYELRDEAMIGFTQGRAGLNELNEKLGGPSKKRGGAFGGLIKMAGPAMMLFLSKEKSMMRWGMFGLKIANNLFEMYKERTKKGRAK